MATIRRAVLATLALVAAVGASARVDAVGPALANEPFGNEQWALEQVEAEAAWQVAKGAGALVGIVDTGVDLRHEELQSGKVADATRCVGTEGDDSRCGGSAQDDNGHGTHVAGVIAAPLNGRGVGGVAPDARLLVVKSVGADGTGYADDVVAAIRWLVRRGAQVINLSLADAATMGRIGDAGSPIGQAIREAWSQNGVVFVLAAGNSESGSGGQSQNYGSLPAIIVGATNKDDRLTPYSLPLGNAQWGVAAPGGDGAGAPASRKIVSSFWFGNRPSEHYAYSQGTSVAAPHVSGVAALAVSRGLRGQAVVDAVLDTADPVGCGQGCHGRVNARRAVDAPPLPAPPPTTPKPVPPSPPTAPPVPVTHVAAPPAPGSSTTTSLSLPDLPFETAASPSPPAEIALPPASSSGEGMPALLGVVGAAAVAMAALGTATVGYRSRRRTVTTRP